MNTPTYKQQFDKLTRAYINDEVQPYDNCACFVGNLLNNSSGWVGSRFTRPSTIIPDNILYTPISHALSAAEKCIQREANGLYTLAEIERLETIFMARISKLLNSPRINTGFFDNVYKIKHKMYVEGYEEALFEAFELTLAELKAIHIAKGEVIDEAPVFEKRKLERI